MQIRTEEQRLATRAATPDLRDLVTARGRYDYLFAAERGADWSNDQSPCPPLALAVVPDAEHDADINNGVDIFGSLLRFVIADVSDPESDQSGTMANRRTGALDLDHLYAASDRTEDGGIVLRDDAPFASDQRAIAETFARLHCMCLDHAPLAGRDSRFAWAREQTQWTYQWLVINDLLPQVCDTDILQNSLSENAPIYGAFLARLSDANFGCKLPVPLEFSAAAMPAPSPAKDQESAQITYLFDVTGDPRHAALFPDPAKDTTAFWSTDTGPCFNMDGSFDARRTYRMPKSDQHTDTTHATLAARLHLPSAETCLGTPSDTGSDMPIAQAQDAETQTNLGSYLLVEADAWSEGRTFGPLGSRIVAETLIGLVQHTPGSFWSTNQAGTEGRWHPRHGIRPNGDRIDSFETLARVTQMM